jgi:hypothetical protein
MQQCQRSQNMVSVLTAGLHSTMTAGSWCQTATITNCNQTHFICCRIAEFCKSKASVQCIHLAYSCPDVVPATTTVVSKQHWLCTAAASAVLADVSVSLGSCPDSVSVVGSCVGALLQLSHALRQANSNGWQGLLDDQWHSCWQAHCCCKVRVARQWLQGWPR